jgi:hypothetical protein
MKKVLKIFIITILITIILIIGAAIVIPIVFKPQLLELAKTEINKNVNANVEFSDFKVSIFKGFPDVYIGLMDLSIVGIDEFEGQTLVAFDEFSVKVDIKSVIKMENMQVKSILLINPIMAAIITPEGKANWDIFVFSDEEEEIIEEVEEEPMTMRVVLEKLEIRNATISYIDGESDMKATIENLNFVLSGDMGMDQTDLQIKTTIASFNFFMDGIRYVRNAPVAFDAEIGADLMNDVYTFNDNLFSINDISLNFKGSVLMPTDDIDVNITFSTPKTDFKSLLSMIPAIYMSDFEGLETSGNLSLNGWVKGSVTETTLPSVGIDLTVSNARFQYPDLPKAVENVSVKTKIFYDGVDEDKTTIDVSKFHLEMAGNPFDIALSVRTPMSDMYVAGSMVGVIDFNSLADVIPLEDMTIAGILESNMEFGGLMSYIENEQYEKFKADGSLKLVNFEFESPDLPQAMKILETTLNFSPKYVQLASFDARIGSSDLQLDGRLENFIPFVFSDETIKGTLNLRSSLIDLNELMGEEAEETTEVQDTVPMSVIEVPKNIDFVLTSNIKKVIFDKLDIDDIKGKIIVRDGKVQMDNVGMNMLKGSMNLTGEYNTQNMEEPKIDFAMDIKNFDIPSAFRSFSMIENMAPQAKKITGNVSTKLSLNAILDTLMTPDLNSINAMGVLGCKSIAIVNAPTFTKIGDLLKNEDISNPRLKDFMANLEVKQGRIYIKPFDTEASGIKMNFGGDMGIDQTIDYKIKLEMPRSKLGPASQALESVTNFAAAKGLSIGQSDVVKLNLFVTGTATNPNVKLDMGDAAQSIKDQVKDQVKEKIDEKVDQAKEEARRKAKEQADKLIRDAEKQAENIRAEARKAAEAVKKEANANAKKVEDEAKGKGVIAERAAKVTADKIRSEGEKAAKKIIDEADAKAKSVIDKAKVEAARIESAAN